MASSKNIIVGAASVHLNFDETASRPAYVSSTSYRTTLAGASGWKDVGFTQDGLEFSYEPDFGEVEVDQLLDTAKMFKQSMRAMVNTTFAEATLENLLFVWAQKASSLKTGVTTGHDGETLQNTDSSLGIAGGALGEAPEENQLIAVGNGTEKTTGSNNYSERIYHARRVLSVEPSTHGLKRSEATVFPVSFRLLPDVAHSGAEYGTITERLKS